MPTDALDHFYVGIYGPQHIPKTMDTHTMAIKMDIFDNEWKPLLKLFSRACINDEIMAHFNEEECERLATFMDCLQDLALEHSK